MLRRNLGLRTKNPSEFTVVRTAGREAQRSPLRYETRCTRLQSVRIKVCNTNRIGAWLIRFTDFSRSVNDTGSIDARVRDLQSRYFRAPRVAAPRSACLCNGPHWELQ